MNIKRFQKSKRFSHAMTGMSYSEIEELSWLFGAQLMEVYNTNRPERQRKAGAGQHGELRTPIEKLIAVLIYMKAYMTYDVLGFLLNLDRSNACRNIQFLLPVLEKTLKRKLVLPERKISSVEEFFEKFPEAKDVFLDGTERRVQKPVSVKKRNKLYSGKKKGVTRKNVIMSTEKKRILIITPTKSGRRHDKKLADKADLIRVLPEHVTAWVDTGFQGIQHQHKRTMLPKKRTKKHPLSDEERADNRLISGIRVVAEHAIAGIKRYGCVSQVYRNRLPNLDDTFILLSAGLWNYHLSFTS